MRKLRKDLKGAEIGGKNRKCLALFVDSLSTDPIRIRIPAFWPAEVARFNIQQELDTSALGLLPALTAFGGDFYIGSHRCLTNYLFAAN